jgi:hypothetical protein
VEEESCAYTVDDSEERKTTGATFKKRILKLVIRRETSLGMRVKKSVVVVVVIIIIVLSVYRANNRKKELGNPVTYTFFKAKRITWYTALLASTQCRD